jgi:peptide/nickel transport system ATP-binding protein
MTETPLLDVDGLVVRYSKTAVVDEVTFAVRRERVAIVGQSGSGKSTVGRAILRLLPRTAAVSAVRLHVDGVDLLKADRATLRAMRGRRVGLVLQDAKFALNPVMTVGMQMVEALSHGRNMSRKAAREAALDQFAAVGFDDPSRVFGLYPHQVSGGMGQRAMIAMALAGEPQLLIADEPTSALDATSRIEILTLLDTLIARRHMGLLLISHDLDLVAGFCDRILVMQAGRIVDRCAVADLALSRHPYTRELLAARLPPLAS